MAKKILIPTDLTEAADHAIRQAVSIATKAQAELTLFHVFDKHDSSLEDVERSLTSLAEMITLKSKLVCHALVKEGNVFDMIISEAIENEYDLVVIATHGYQGLRQKLFGADIFKLVSKIPVTTLVVQKESKLIDEMKKIIFPVSSHADFHHAVNAVLFCAEIFKPDIDIYSISKPGFEWPGQLRKNIEFAGMKFQEKGIHINMVKEEQNVYSIGYSRQTLNYAMNAGADCICVMTPASQDYYYFAQFDKECLLVNDQHIPILCAGGRGD
jgi:nucleotide-binding universal stress UspA family protein